jgi:hypothetical protein
MVSGNKVRPDIDELGVALGMTLHEVRETTRDEPTADPNADTKDPEPRKGVGEPRATSREISARVRSQVDKAFRDGTFGKDFKITMGYRRRFVQSLVSEGFAAHEAEAKANELYGRVERWSQEAVGIGADEYSGSSDFMSMFDRLMDSEIDNLRV